jgi:nitrogen fixation NifU-like protein
VNVDELYQELVVDHGRRPRNRRPMPDATHACEGFNPICGDHFTLRLRVDDGVVAAATFEGEGCAISTASASLLTEAVRGRSAGEFELLFGDVLALATGGRPDRPLGKLEALSGVSAFPMRVKCATLAWHAARGALRGASVASTE